MRIKRALLLIGVGFASAIFGLELILLSLPDHWAFFVGLHLGPHLLDFEDYHYRDPLTYALLRLLWTIGAIAIHARCVQMGMSVRRKRSVGAYRCFRAVAWLAAISSIWFVLYYPESIWYSWEDVVFWLVFGIGRALTVIWIGYAIIAAGEAVRSV